MASSRDSAMVSSLLREVADAKAAAESEGKTVVAVGWDGQARGILVVADTVKPTSAEAISQLKQIGLTPVLLTGDNEAVARQIAAEVGIDQVIAEVLPEVEKALPSGKISSGCCSSIGDVKSDSCLCGKTTMELVYSSIPGSDMTGE